jgi:hypothetical protein
LALCQNDRSWLKIRWDHSINDLSLRQCPIAQQFTSSVAPILKNNCVSCHPGYDTREVAMDKAEAYKIHLTNKTMSPAPNAPLSDADTKIILDWYASIPL